MFTSGATQLATGLWRWQPKNRSNPISRFNRPCMSASNQFASITRISVNPQRNRAGDKTMWSLMAVDGTIRQSQSNGQNTESRFRAMTANTRLASASGNRRSIKAALQFACLSPAGAYCTQLTRSIWQLCGTKFLEVSLRKIEGLT